MTSNDAFGFFLFMVLLILALGIVEMLGSL